MRGYTLSLEGKTAFVTGASSGLGEHFARTLSAAGANVVLGARRTERIEKLAAEFCENGADARAVHLDVTDEESCDKALDFAVAAYGRLDILVNNAGIAFVSRALNEPEDEWRRTMDVNLDSVWRMARKAASIMVQKDTGGSIINIASILGTRQGVGQTSYAVSKAGVVQLTKQLALELARFNIRVNAIAPGYFETEINSGFFDTEAGKEIVSRIPMRRIGEMDEIEGPLMLLASRAGQFMTGSVLTVDGGHLVSRL